ncbi:hypothetical protein TrRE_jg13019 [Triparma retinervis]|uniref:Uncharacterized protein n=1 Tax=Triparma retinervis TaxID=2557542 RepID=A0A9W7A707_9STRA|nr:hypothetical protein TrRE_jg13019 [Triparma retinervis]
MELYKRNKEVGNDDALYMDTDSEFSETFSENGFISTVSREEIKVELVGKSMGRGRGRGGMGRTGRLKAFMNRIFQVEGRRLIDEMLVEETYARASNYARARHLEVIKEAELANKSAQNKEVRQTSEIQRAVKLARRRSIIENIENTRLVRDSMEMGIDMGSGCVVPVAVEESRRRSQSPKYRGGGKLAETLLSQGGGGGGGGNQFRR